ncbi:MAG TPA: hypothetical protein VGH33_12660, partial [Isosphaeraceae bacterium]
MSTTKTQTDALKNPPRGPKADATPVDPFADVTIRTIADLEAALVKGPITKATAARLTTYAEYLGIEAGWARSDADQAIGDAGEAKLTLVTVAAADRGTESQKYFSLAAKAQEADDAAAAAQEAASTANSVAGLARAEVAKPRVAAPAPEITLEDVKEHEVPKPAVKAAKPRGGVKEEVEEETEEETEEEVRPAARRKARKPAGISAFMDKHKWARPVASGIAGAFMMFCLTLGWNLMRGDGISRGLITGDVQPAQWKWATVGDPAEVAKRCYERVARLSGAPSAIEAAVSAAKAEVIPGGNVAFWVDPVSPGCVDVHLLSNSGD